jgi:geranylgeranyl reductase family protein
VTADTYDLIVVGAGPAGSAAALGALRERPGARVLLLDRAALGRDKVCGDGIAPHAVAELATLGVTATLPEESVPVVRLVSPSGADRSAATQSAGYVVPRATFDERLARAAIEAGAEFQRERVTTVMGDDAGVTVNGRFRAPAVIAADGANSVVRRLVGERPNRGAALAVAIRGYAPTPQGYPRELVLRWDIQRNGGLCYAWAFPTADGRSNVGYGMSARGVERATNSAGGGAGGAGRGGRALLLARLRALLPEFDLGGVELRGHTLPLTVFRPRAAVGRVLLAGDAASLINPFTGEGIFSAIASGALAGRTAVREPATAGARYRSDLARRFGSQHRQFSVLYPLVEFRSVLDTVIRACQRDTRNFDRLLEVGLGDARFSVADIHRFASGLRR